MGLKTKCVGTLLALASLCSYSFAQSHSGIVVGRYAIENVVDQGKTVQVTMTLRLVNGTNADLKNALLILSDHLPALPPKGGMAVRAVGAPGAMTTPIHNHGSARIAIIRMHRDLELRGINFTVPSFEYQQWQRGAPPVFFVSYQTANGGQVQMPVQLVRER